MSQGIEEKRSQISDAAKNRRYHYDNDNIEKQKNKKKTSLNLI